MDKETRDLVANLRLLGEDKYADRVAEMYEALQETQSFLTHIQHRVGEAAFEHIWDTVTSALNNGAN